MAVQFLLGIKALTDQAKLRANLQKLYKEIGKEMYQFGEQVMGESKAVYCPVDTGLLRSTGRVGFPEKQGNFLIVTLSYGSAACNYAVHVHETNKHYRNGKQWKYLETPLKAATPLFPQRVRDAADRVIGKRANP